MLGDPGHGPPSESAPEPHHSWGAPARATNPSDSTLDVQRGRLLNALVDGGAADATSAGVGAYVAFARSLRGGVTSLAALVAEGLLASSDDPCYPARLGTYPVERILGRGGMGIVLKGFDPGLKRPVALKLLRPELCQDAAAVARFEREARAAGSLQHPNIVTIHALGRLDGPAARTTDGRDAHAADRRAVHTPLPYIAMEYVDGPSLAEVIRGAWASGPCFAATGATDSDGPEAHAPHDLIRHVFRQLLEALSAAHAAGLIHRDVKSSNILLDCGLQIADCGLWTRDLKLADRLRVELQSAIINPQSAIVKLADFGLARLQGSQTQVTQTGSILGTPEYMSPEQARGDTDIDHRTDLYSAGVVLYEMLTGQTPFRCDTPTATIHRILHEAPPDPRKLDKHVDPVLASLALRLMAKRREDRFASAGEIIAVLDAGTRVRVPRLRGRWARSASIIVGVLIVAGAVLLLRDRIRAHVSGPITELRVSEDRKDILAWYGDDSEPKHLRWLENDGYRDDVASVAAATATLADGRQVIAVASEEPLNDRVSTLIAFNSVGRPIWRWAPDPGWGWPDVKPSGYWLMKRLTAVDLDGLPGDEFIVVATHPHDYPTRLSIIDPATGTVRSTLWHFGQIAKVRVVPSYFDDNKPAVLVWGMNNKLDGFDDELREPERQFSHWGMVWTVMIIHAEHMHGLAPPPVNRERLTESGWPKGEVETAQVWAYAFLDLPCSGDEPYVPHIQPREEVANWRVTMPEIFAAYIGEVLTPAVARDARVELQFVPTDEELDRANGTYLALDSKLALLSVADQPPGARGKLGIDKAFWERNWRVIMRDGEYVDE